MKIDERKEKLKLALTNSFVDDYKAYKNIIRNINKDFKKLNINFKYSYNQFCVEFLNESLKQIESVDIFEEVDQYNEFFINFYNFNLYILQNMLKSKINNLGFNSIDCKYFLN